MDGAGHWLAHASPLFRGRFPHRRGPKRRPSCRRCVSLRLSWRKRARPGATPTFCCTAPLPAHVVQRRGCPGHRGRLARSRAGSAVGQAAPATRSEIFCSSCLLGAGHPGRHAASPKHMREGRAWAGRRRCVSTASCLKKGREWPRTGTRGAEIAAGETLAVGSTQTSDDRPCCTVAVAAVSPSSRSSAFRLLLCFASVDRSVGGGGFRFGGPSRGVAALHQPPRSPGSISRLSSHPISSCAGPIRRTPGCRPARVLTVPRVMDALG